MTWQTAEQELMLSIRKSYDLYHYLLLLLIALSDVARGKATLSRKKNIPAPEDINPNTRFAENRIIAQLRNNEQLHHYAEATTCAMDEKRPYHRTSGRSAAGWVRWVSHGQITRRWSGKSLTR